MTTPVAPTYGLPPRALADPATPEELARRSWVLTQAANAAAGVTPVGIGAATPVAVQPGAPSSPRLGDVWVDSDDLTGDALIRPLVLDVRTFGARPDCVQPNGGIAGTSGQTTITLQNSPAFATLTAGMKLIIEGAGNTAYTVQSVGSGTAVLTSPLTATVSGARCMFGTDNTAAFNAWFAACAAQRANGNIPPGRFLITGTIGYLEPQAAPGLAGLQFLVGGSSVQPMRLAYTDTTGGTTLVWAGAVGGTMLQLCRTSAVRFVGGLTLAGQACSDPGGVFSTFGPRAGKGLHVSQSGTPETGTGYVVLDELTCTDMDLAVQFGTNTTDNNCDTSVIRRSLLIRCGDGIVIKHNQGLSYRFDWVHGISVPGSVVRFEQGGAVEIGVLHASVCGTATADPTTDRYILDCTSTTTAFAFNVGLMRIENGSVRAVAARNFATHVRIGMFTEANIANTDKALFYLAGGTVVIGGGFLYSAKASGECPFYLYPDGNSRQPRLSLSEVMLATTAWEKLFTISGATVADISLVATRDTFNRPLEDRHTRLERGRVVLGGPTTDAATSTQLDPMMRLGGTSYAYSYGPRIPTGVSTIALTIIGDRLTAAPSVFRRRVTFYRDGSGNVTVVGAVQTVGTDTVQGTDQVAVVGFMATYLNLRVEVKGTAAVGINWRCVAVLEASSMTPLDY